MPECQSTNSVTSVATGRDYLALNTLRVQCSGKRRVFLMRFQDLATFWESRNEIDPTIEDLMSCALKHITDDHPRVFKDSGTLLGADLKPDPLIWFQGTSSSGTHAPSRLTVSASASFARTCWKTVTGNEDDSVVRILGGRGRITSRTHTKLNHDGAARKPPEELLFEYQKTTNCNDTSTMSRWELQHNHTGVLEKVDLGDVDKEMLGKATPIRGDPEPPRLRLFGTHSR